MTSIAPIAHTDHDEWLALWEGYLEFYGADIDEKTTNTTFARICDPQGVIQGAIARDANGHAVGIAHWLAHPATWTAATYCYLEDLFVTPEVRGSGIGSALIQHVRDWAEDHGSSKVYWLTAEDNARARRLCDHVADVSGMVQYQIKLDA